MKNMVNKKIIPKNSEGKINEMWRREEQWLFHQMKQLKRHHQIAFAFIIFCGVTFLWRGLWNLLDIYWFPHSPLFSSLSCIVIGAILLFFTNELIYQLIGGGRFKR